MGVVQLSSIQQQVSNGEIRGRKPDYKYYLHNIYAWKYKVKKYRLSIPLNFVRATSYPTPKSAITHIYFSVCVGYTLHEG